MEEKEKFHQKLNDFNFYQLITEIPQENLNNNKQDQINDINQLSSPNISNKFNTIYKNEELNKFKDEILSFFKERESYLISKIKTYQSQIESTEKKYETLTKIIKLNYQEILSSQANINNRLDKLKNYEQFVLKTNDNLTSHEIRINNLRDDFSKATQKYDKIYLDNLELPGFIGRCAKYKNCQLFFADVIKELNKFNNYKEKNNIDLRTYKEKLEQMIKTFKTMVDNNNEAQIKYINKSNEKNINECKNMVDVLGDRVVELRLENSKYSVELINKTNEIKEQMNKIKEMKGELLNEFYHKIEDYKNMTNNITKSFNEFKNEYSVIRKKFLELAEFIKDIRFKKNLGGDVDKKEINNLYKNIVKKVKKTSKDKNVQLLDDITNIEKMEFKTNNKINNLSNNKSVNNNEKFERGNKRHETYNSTNNLINIIRETYFDFNENQSNKEKEVKRNFDIFKSKENLLKIKNKSEYIIDENKLEEKVFNNIIDNNKEIKNDSNKDKNKENIYKSEKLSIDSNNNIIIKTNNGNINNLVIANEKIDKKTNENKLREKNSSNKIISNKENINIINNENNNDIIIKNDIKEIKEKDIINKIQKDNNQILTEKENINEQNETKKDEIKSENLKHRKIYCNKKQITSATSDNISISDSFNSNCNNLTIGGTGTVSDKNISNISMPISYNINTVKCNKFVLNDNLQDDNDNKIIKELASELEQSTAKKIKILGSQQKPEENNFHKIIIQNMQPINLINNIKNKETNANKDNININNNINNNDNKQISQSQEKSNKNLEKKESLSVKEKTPKLNINKLLNNNQLKSLINQEIDTDNLNINSDINNNIINNENELCFKSNNSEYNNNNESNNNQLKIDNNTESINRKLYLFNQKLFDIETYMKDKFIEIIKQIDSLKQLNTKKKTDMQIKPYRTSGFKTDQNVFYTINNDNNSNSNFCIGGKDENYCSINYHTIKSPRFDSYSQFFTTGVKKSFKKYNYFKDNILIDNFNKNKNEEISAIKNFIERKINVNNSKTLYKDFSKKNIKSMKSKNGNFINGDSENEHMIFKMKNNSTITGNDMKWIDLKVLMNKKIHKNSSCQKLNPILSGENK